MVWKPFYCLILTPTKLLEVDADDAYEADLKSKKLFTTFNLGSIQCLNIKLLFIW